MLSDIETSDPDELRVQDFDVRNSVFVIPVDAPVPSELADVEMPKGTLYDRLRALNVETTDEFAFVPLSGAELLSLERSWRSFQVAKRVFALFDLPGARYDVMFTQSVRLIGLRRIEWPAVAEGLASRTRTVQRTKDATPWNLKDNKPSGSKFPRSMDDTGEALPTPEGTDEN
jgi:hypothetical protein